MLFGRKKDTGRDEPADIEPRDGGGVAVAEAPPLSAPEKVKDKGKKKDDDDLEYEWELETPFGKIEFEFEPSERKEQKEREKREKAERAAAKQAAKLAKKAEKAAKTRATAGEMVVVKRSNLLPALVIFAIVVGAIALAYWLFARPGDEDEDIVPEEYRAADAPVAESQGLAARVKKAIRAGRQASREAQREQQQKFEEATQQQ